MAKRVEIENLILKYQRRLQKLKEKEATLGINAPPEILTELEDIEEEIEKLQAELKQLKSEPSVEVTHHISGPTPRSHYIEFGKASLAIIFLLGFGVTVFIFLSSQAALTPANGAIVTSNTPTTTSILPTYTTETLTNTPPPEATNTPAETSTPIPPSATPTATPTLIPIPIATPAPTPTAHLGSIIDDFENYDNTSLINDFVINRNAGNEGSVILVGPPHIYQGRQALGFEFDIRNSRPNHYIGFDREFPPQDWSNYASLCLWVESDGSNRSLVVQFGESKYKFWKNIVSLTNIGVGEHCISLREAQQIDVRAIGYYGVYVEGPPQGQGVIYIDDVRVVN